MTLDGVEGRITRALRSLPINTICVIYMRCTAHFAPSCACLVVSACFREGAEHASKMVRESFHSASVTGQDCQPETLSSVKRRGEGGVTGDSFPRWWIFDGLRHGPGLEGSMTGLCSRLKLEACTHGRGGGGV